MHSFEHIYVQAWIRPYIRSFDHIYVQGDLIYLTLDLMYQILAIYLKDRLLSNMAGHTHT